MGGGDHSQNRRPQRIATPALSSAPRRVRADARNRRRRAVHTDVLPHVPVPRAGNASVGPSDAGGRSAKATPTVTPCCCGTRTTSSPASPATRAPTSPADFADDPSQYRKLQAGLTRRHSDVAGQLGEIPSLPTPAEMLRPGFIDELDLHTRPALIAQLLDIRCHKAGRPGIRFEATERLDFGASCWRGVAAGVVLPDAGSD